MRKASATKAGGVWSAVSRCTLAPSTATNSTSIRSAIPFTISPSPLTWNPNTFSFLSLHNRPRSSPPLAPRVLPRRGSLCFLSPSSYVVTRNVSSWQLSHQIYLRQCTRPFVQAPTRAEGGLNIVDLMAQLPTLETAKWVPIWKAQRLLQHSWEQRDIELRYRVFKLLPKVESDDPAKWLKLFKTVAIHPHRPWMLPLLMQRMRDQKVPWTVELFTILLKDQALHGEKDRIIEVLANLNKTGLAKDVAFYTTLISAYGMHKQLDEAFAVIDQMKADKLVPNEVTFTALIAACGDSREPQMALKAFSLMQEHGVQPNVLTLTALLTAFAEAGEIEAIHKTVMEELMKKYDLKPTTTTFNEVMKGYCRVKNPTKVLETYETLKQSGLTPDAHTFFHLFTVALHPLQDFQDEERVKRQVEGLFGEMQRYGLEPGYKILQCVRSARWKDRQAKKKVEDRIMQAIANKVRT